MNTKTIFFILLFIGTQKAADQDMQNPTGTKISLMKSLKRKNSDTTESLLPGDDSRPLSPGRSGLSGLNERKKNNPSKSLPTSPRIYQKCESKKDPAIVFFEKKMRQLEHPADLEDALKNLRVFKRDACILKENCSVTQVAIIAGETSLKELRSQLEAKKSQRSALKKEIKSLLEDLYDRVLGYDQHSRAQHSSTPTDEPDEE